MSIGMPVACMRLYTTAGSAGIRERSFSNVMRNVTFIRIEWSHLSNKTVG